eukprot:s5561_g3.t3
MHKDAEKLADEVLSTLDKHGLTVRRAFLSTNCKDAADLEELTKKLGMEIVQFKDLHFLSRSGDMIIASEAPLFVPSSYSSSFAKTILFHRVKGKQKIEEDVRTALLNVDNRRTASVRSLARCDVAIISRFSFHSILEKYPWEKRKFQREMKHKLMELGKLIDVKDDINLEQQATQCDALKQLPFFSDNSESMHEFVAELAMNTSTYWYQPGKVLLEEGDVNCDEMFILLRGACEVSSCGQFLGRIENDVIGEIGILDLLERRTATVTTATACQCMKLSRQVMVPILAKYPDARLRLLELARTRLTAINEAMSGPQDGPERGTVAVQDLCGRLPGCAIGFGPHVPKTHQSTTNVASLGPSLMTHSVGILFWWTWCLLPVKGFTSQGPRRLRLATASASSRSQVQLRALPEVPSFSVRDRLLIWQPLIAAVLIFGTYAFIIWKSNRAADARDRRMEKELELRRLRGLQLVRGNAGEDEVEACAAELEELKLDEKSEREIIGWGVASPTSRRYSLELSSLPQTDVSREYLLMQPAKTEIETERSSAGSDDSEWVESLAVLIGTVDASLLAMNPMFQDAPIPLVYALSQRMVDKKFEDGEVILKDGEVFQPGHDFVYFILKGEVEIWKDGNFIVLLRDGETFGDLAALRKLAARQATAKAKGQVTCRAVRASSDTARSSLTIGSDCLCGACQHGHQAMHECWQSAFLVALLIIVCAGRPAWTFWTNPFRRRAVPSMEDLDSFYQSLAGSAPPRLTDNPGPLPCSGHFTEILEKALDRWEAGDEGLKPHVLHSTEEFVTIYDGYPKAAVHLLVLPRLRVAGLAQVKEVHLPMIRRLAAYVAWIMEILDKSGAGWMHGIHAVPSLRQLHVHLLTLDMNTPAMKNAKHFNSFRPPFLVSLDEVLSTLERGGFPERYLEGLHEDMKKRSLCCHRCGMNFGRSFAGLKRPSVQNA